MSPKEPSATIWGRPWTALAALLLLTVLAYANSFKAPLAFDDGWHILENPAVRSFAGMLGGLTHTNRPLALFLNWLNFEIGGTNPFGYHLLNLGIHLANSALIFFILLATPGGTGDPEEPSRLRIAAAFAASLFFALHPVHTMAVTYIIQGRMVGTATLGVLLSLFFFQRAAVRERPYLLIFAFGAFLVGIMGKETAAVAPFLCLIYDRLFLAPKGYGGRGARLAYHASGLLVVLGAAAFFLGYHRADTIGFGARNTTPLGYLFTQFGVIVTYLRLLVFPATLKIHHQITDARGLFYVETLAPLAFLCIILAGFLWLGKRDRRFAFGILWFFIALAPTSSAIPIIDRLFEYRLYLPSIGFSFILAATLERVRLSKRAWAGVFIIPLLLGVRTFDRNLDWQHPLEIYLVEARLSPGHYRALTFAVNELSNAGRITEAVHYAKKLLKVKPDSPDAYILLGKDAYNRGEVEEARSYFKKALEADRIAEIAYACLGHIERKEGDLEAARKLFLKAHKIKGNYLWAVVALGKLAEKTGDTEAELKWYGKAFGLFPDNTEVARYYGDALKKAKKDLDAAGVYKKCLEHNPKSVEVLSELGITYYRLARPKDALGYFRRAAELSPEDPKVVENLANCLFAVEDFEKARLVYLRFIELAPRKSGMARAYLARSLLHLGRVEEGLARLAESCESPDGDVEACFELGMFHDHFKRYKEAAAAYLRFLKRGGEPFRGYFNLGMLYLEKLGERQKGLYYLKKSLEAKPDHKLAHIAREKLSQEEK